MRVLMTADTIGGVFTYAVELAAALRGLGDEVVLATLGPPASVDQRRRIRAAGVAGWHQRDLAAEWMEQPWEDQELAGRWLVALARRERPDVVHLNAFTVAAAGWRQPLVVAAHSDVTSWWRAVHGEEAPSRWNRYRAAVAAGLRHADAVAAPTRAMLSALRDSYAFAAPAHVIPNGLAGADTPARGRSEPVVLAAGRLWDEAKNLGLLVRAAPALAPGTVRLAGDTGGAAVGGCVALGHLGAAALAAERRRARVFAAPARYEPFGLAILEAARDGCALVLGDIPSLRELWDGVAAFVHPDDVDGLAGTLARLLDDEALAHRLGLAARERAQDFTAARMGRAYHDLYVGLRRRMETAA